MKLRLQEGVERFGLTADIEIIIDGMKIGTVVAVSETDGEDARLENNLPGIKDVLMLLLMT